jgi:hypothetical protein
MSWTPKRLHLRAVIVPTAKSVAYSTTKNVLYWSSRPSSSQGVSACPPPHCRSCQPKKYLESTSLTRASLSRTRKTALPFFKKPTMRLFSPDSSNWPQSYALSSTIKPRRLRSTPYTTSPATLVARIEAGPRRSLAHLLRKLHLRPPPPRERMGQLQQRRTTRHYHLQQTQRSRSPNKRRSIREQPVSYHSHPPAPPLHMAGSHRRQRELGHRSRPQSRPFDTRRTTELRRWEFPGRSPWEASGCDRACFPGYLGARGAEEVSTW